MAHVSQTDTRASGGPTALCAPTRAQDWEADLRANKVPNAEGLKKHGWPEWDDVVFSHMTPFVWASNRAVSGAFLKVRGHMPWTWKWETDAMS